MMFSATTDQYHISSTSQKSWKSWCQCSFYLFERTRSASGLSVTFHAEHSIVLVRLLFAIFSAMNSGDMTLLALLNVLAAYDSVDHDILLERFQRNFVVCRTYCSVVAGAIHPWTYSQCGYQRWEIRMACNPLWSAARIGFGSASIYVLFTAVIPQIIHLSGLPAQQYDNQDYVHCQAAGAVDAMDRFLTVLDDPHQSRQDPIYLAWKPISTQKIDQFLSTKFCAFMLCITFAKHVSMDELNMIGRYRC